MKIPQFLFLLCLLTFSEVHAQYRSSYYKAGVALNAALKLPVWGKGPGFSPLFNAGAQAFLYLEGKGYRALATYIKGGIQYDKIAYTVEKGRSFNAGVLSLSLNPQIAIPSGFENLKYTFGFGVDFILRQAMDLSITSTNLPGGYQLDLAEAHDQIQSSLRPVVPYFSGGMLLKQLPGHKGERFHLEVYIKQALLNLFQQPATISYSKHLEKKTYPIREYYPPFVGLTIGYGFVRK